MTREEYVLLEAMSSIRREMKDTSKNVKEIAAELEKMIELNEMDKEKFKRLMNSSFLLGTKKYLDLEKHCYLKRVWSFYRRGWLRRSKRFKELIDDLIRTYNIDMTKHNTKNYERC